MEDEVCPICCNELTDDDKGLIPCKCGFQICLWCLHKMKDEMDGKCPACRSPYNEANFVYRKRDSKKSKDKRNGTKLVGSLKSKARKPPSKSREHLKNVRVIQRNLVYVIGLAAKCANETVLRQHRFFGQYGTVLKVVINRTYLGNDERHNSASAYITFARKEDARTCVMACDGFIMEGKTLKASFGTTKYCNSFLRANACGNPDCLYLHDMGDGTDSFTKEEMNIHMGRFQTQINPGRGGIGRPGPKSGTIKVGLPPPSLVLDDVSKKQQQQQKTPQKKKTGGNVIVKPKVASPIAWGGQSSLNIASLSSKTTMSPRQRLKSSPPSSSTTTKYSDASLPPSSTTQFVDHQDVRSSSQQFSQPARLPPQEQQQQSTSLFSGAGFSTSSSSSLPPQQQQQQTSSFFAQDPWTMPFPTTTSTTSTPTTTSNMYVLSRCWSSSMLENISLSLSLSNNIYYRHSNIHIFFFRYASLPAMLNGPSIWAMGGFTRPISTTKQPQPTRDVDSSNALKAFLGIGTEKTQQQQQQQKQDWTSNSSWSESKPTTNTSTTSTSWKDPWDTTSSMSNLNLNTSQSFPMTTPQLSPPIIPSSSSHNDQRNRRRSRGRGNKRGDGNVTTRRRTRRSGRSRPKV